MIIESQPAPRLYFSRNGSTPFLTSFLTKLSSSEIGEVLMKNRAGFAAEKYEKHTKIPAHRAAKIGRCKIKKVKEAAAATI